MQDAQDLLSDALDTAENMTNTTSVSDASTPDSVYSCVWCALIMLCLQKLEEMKADVDLLSPALRKHVDTLVMELTARDALQLVYRAEDHAQALSRAAQNLNR